jgi:hypothetical protein
MNNVIKIDSKIKQYNFYEVADQNGIAIWGGESSLEAIRWLRRSPAESRVWVSVWESGEEDAGVTTDPIDITSIVLATIADTMERWGK